MSCCSEEGRVPCVGLHEVGRSPPRLPQRWSTERPKNNCHRIHLTPIGLSPYLLANSTSSNPSDLRAMAKMWSSSRPVRASVRFAQQAGARHRRNCPLAVPARAAKDRLAQRALIAKGASYQETNVRCLRRVANGRPNDVSREAAPRGASDVEQGRTRCGRSLGTLYAAARRSTAHHKSRSPTRRRASASKRSRTSKASRSAAARAAERLR